MINLAAQFKHIHYYDDFHRYTCNGKTMESVTRFIGKFMPKFRKKYWLAQGACKEHFPNNKVVSDISRRVQPDHILIEGVGKEGQDVEIHMDTVHKHLKKTVNEIKAKWKKESEFGKRKGLFVHKYLEARSQNKRPNIGDYDDEIRPYIIAAEAFVRKYEPQVLYNELVIGSEELGLAGTTDAWEYNNLLTDYKTDKRIDQGNPWSKMKAPIDHLEASSLNKHFLQVNLYAYIIEKETNIKASGMRIVNFQPMEYKVIDVPDMRREILDMINWEKITV